MLLSRVTYFLRTKTSTHPMLPADLERCISATQAFLEETGSHFEELVEKVGWEVLNAAVYRLHTVLPALIKAYDLEIVSVKELNETLVVPFLHLACLQMAIHKFLGEGNFQSSHPTDQQSRLDGATIIFRIWAENLKIAFFGYGMETGPIMGPAKRLGFMKELLSEGFAEVRSLVSGFLPLLIASELHPCITKSVQTWESGKRLSQMHPGYSLHMRPGFSFSPSDLSQAPRY